jgi:hypothetical protein
LQKPLWLENMEPVQLEEMLSATDMQQYKVLLTEALESLLNLLNLLSLRKILLERAHIIN